MSARRPVELPEESGEKEESPGWWSEDTLADEEDLLVDEEEFESTEAEDPWDELEDLLAPAEGMPADEEALDEGRLGDSGFATPDQWPAESEDEGEP